jgi:LDH2 family malate/lactate/ureidoglycolate dehydrogenase
VEILSGVLSGGAMSTELGGLRIRGKRFRASQTFLAIDVGRMQPDFTARVDWLIGVIKETMPASGFDEVLVANEPELRTERKRLKEGIPIPDGTWTALLKAASHAGVGSTPVTTSVTT